MEDEFLGSRGGVLLDGLLFVGLGLGLGAAVVGGFAAAGLDIGLRERLSLAQLFFSTGLAFSLQFHSSNREFFTRFKNITL